MSDIIRLLPDSVANQIAAGEVIQRPASVIKELVENSVDAGASSITIVLKDAGRTLIQVVDNGSGMSDTDALMAFERHATSKITEAADLFSLHTMGFRGEALASIAAVSQVELVTMQRGATLGTRLIINGSKVESQEPEACVAGSNMMVKNLFFNVPARRKFLKKDTVEMSAIMREFERLALVNTGVDFTLVSNDVTVHSLMHGSFKRRICDLFGKNLDKQLIPVETDTSIVGIQGFVGLPENARRRNPLQFFMVNGRNMRHPYFHKAVMQCYEHLIPADSQPNYFINLRVDPETIDVNIHPTKNEIKFENEQGIWQILTAAIRDSLGRFNVGPSLDFNRDNDVPEIPVFDPSDRVAPEIDIDPSYNPFGESVPSATEFFGQSGVTGRRHVAAPRENTAGGSLRGTLRAPVTDWAQLYDDFMRKRDEGLDPEPGSGAALPAVESDTAAGATVPAPEHRDGALPFEATAPGGGAMQYRNSYIITSSREGLMVIDQHRAHLRVLYDRYMAKTGVEGEQPEFAPQATMFPEILELSPSQSAVMSELREPLKCLGFVVTPRGENRWSVDGIPARLSESSPRETLLAMIDNVTETGLDLNWAMREQVALSMARSGAVRRGQPLSSDEIDSLLSELFSSTSPTLAPDGKKILTILPDDTFQRILG
ncbi:MAG: DNA mismatch repair endonuclease MutL [Bacteroides sp.]|nr:DNA mismatch repair endonuclease MutL [Bacteroides sp.]